MGTIARETVRSNFPPPRYIIVGYDPEHYESRFIRDEDVVRPPNHRNTDSDTPSTWARDRSTAACPTYGSCQVCFMCGPVDECCDNCGKNVRYLVAFYNRRTTDSITLAETIGTGLKRARANRTQAWLRTPMMNFTSDALVMAVNRLHSLSEEQKRARRDAVYDLLGQMR